MEENRTATVEAGRINCVFFTLWDIFVWFLYVAL